MQLRKIEIIKYKNFENTIIDFEKSTFPNVFSIASKNGGGKSTLLQFIFILLHCFMDEQKKQYIQNMLIIFSDITKDLELVKFMIEDNNKIYNLNFSIIKNKTKNMNFDLYLDVKDTKEEIKKQLKIGMFHKVMELQHELQHASRITPVIKTKIRAIRNDIKSEGNTVPILKNDIKVYQEFIDSLIHNYNISKDTPSELEILLANLEDNLNSLETTLLKNNLKYITHLPKYKNILLIETTMSDNQLIKLSKNVFLTAPSSQIFQFLTNVEKQEIFTEFNGSSSYYDNVENAKTLLNNFFTYDFASTELILKSFQKASDEDLKEKRKSGEYGTKYDKLTDDLKDVLDNKEISENEDGNKVIFTSKQNKQELSPEDLSHGELKKLGIYIWLKYIVDENSIVLMDEVDIALHPEWQYELINDLVKWSKNSQFLIATHSPQILSSTYYKNIIKLQDGKAESYSKPPLDRDINTITTEVMGASDFPRYLEELHTKYRNLMSKGKLKTKEAKELKEIILEHESENSSFFQEINFDLELL